MAKKVTVDFSNTEESKSPIDSIVPGTYNVRVESIEVLQGREHPYLKWTLVITSPVGKGLHLFHNTSLAPNALFNLRDVLVALGMKVPKSAVSINIDKFIGLGFTVEVTLRPYNGKEYPNVKKVMPLNTSMGVAEEDEDEELILDLE